MGVVGRLDIVIVSTISCLSNGLILGKIQTDLMNGKTALITGASRGIGRATALKLASEGADVVINYVSSESDAEDVAAEVREMGSDAITVEADVASLDTVEEMVETAVEFGSGIDCLVNNAGIIPGPSDWQSIDEETWERTFDVNLRGVFNCIREIGPLLVEQGHGSIVNVGSTWSMMGASPVIAYTAAKAGVLSLTQSFASTLAPEVRVNAVAFGTINTDMTAGSGDEFIEKVISETPLNRLGRPGEAAEAIYFLLSDQCEFIHGETLIVDGGHMGH
jgi:3-oxoacyl-[acyl-carrier protein] reductase